MGALSRKPPGLRWGVPRWQTAPVHYRIGAMRMRFLFPIAAALAALWLSAEPAVPTEAAALSGIVRSAGEGPMEGVLVSAKKMGSTITTTVVTDAAGRYRFPRNRLAPGPYTLRIRAASYELDGSGTIELSPNQPATADLNLRQAKNLAVQLTNAEW